MSNPSKRPPACPICRSDLYLYGDYMQEVTATCTECDYEWDSVDAQFNDRPTGTPPAPINPLIPAVYGPILQKQLEDEAKFFNLFKPVWNKYDREHKDKDES